MRPKTLVACFLLVFTCQQATANSTSNLPEKILRAMSEHYAAVVRLNIPLQRSNGTHTYHVNEDCSGTLINSSKGMILTAWHCFDGKMDLTHPPKVWLKGAWQELRLGAHGAGMNHDWAIAYLVNPSVVDVSAMPYALEDLAPGSTVTMTGYQRAHPEADAVWSKKATVCTVTQHSEFWVETDCELNTGASGGAVISMEGGQAKLVGIVSARAATGGVWYVPLSRLGAYFSPP
jgi:V8-like Glu-specific endopeptidase